MFEGGIITIYNNCITDYYVWYIKITTFTTLQSKLLKYRYTSSSTLMASCLGAGPLVGLGTAVKTKYNKHSIKQGKYT